MTLAYLGLGSNLDNPVGQVTQAVQDLDHNPDLRVLRVSPWYGSAAIGPGTQPDYVNGVVEIETDLTPLDLLYALQHIEQHHGRIRDIRWGARTLDIDILLYGDLVVDIPQLQIPHPRLTERRFALQPLADLCPNRKIPCPNNGKSATIADHLRQLPEHGVWRLPPQVTIHTC